MTEERNRGWARSITPRDWAVYVGGALTFGGTLLAGFLRGTELAVTVGTAGVVCIILFRLNDLVRLKLWGLEAELERKLDEATEIMEKLRELALAVADPAVTELALSGQFLKVLKPASKFAMAERVETVLRDIGAPQDRIDDVMFAWRYMVRQVLASRIIEPLAKQHPDLKDGILDLFNGSNNEPRTPDEFREYLTRHELLTEEVDTKLLNYEHYVKYGTLRPGSAFE